LWGDPVAGLVMVPTIAKEGIDGLRSNVCAMAASLDERPS